MNSVSVHHRLAGQSGRRERGAIYRQLPTARRPPALSPRSTNTNVLVALSHVIVASYRTFVIQQLYLIHDSS
jgi:hypothetical protein